MLSAFDFVSGFGMGIKVLVCCFQVVWGAFACAFVCLFVDCYCCFWIVGIRCLYWLFMLVWVFCHFLNLLFNL